jgi:predicted Zn-dependent protease with MMP-like domain
MIRLSQEEFEALVLDALADVPEEFVQHLAEVTIDVQDEPTDRQLRGLGGTRRRDLLGLYEGVPLTRRSVEQMVRWPDRIVLFQRNIERVCRSRRQIRQQVRKTVLHEIGHHFGMDEDDLDELGYG